VPPPAADPAPHRAAATCSSAAADHTAGQGGSARSLRHRNARAASRARSTRKPSARERRPEVVRRPPYARARHAARAPGATCRTGRVEANRGRCPQGPPAATPRCLTPRFREPRPQERGFARASRQPRGCRAPNPPAPRAETRGRLREARARPRRGTHAGPDRSPPRPRRDLLRQRATRPPAGRAAGDRPRADRPVIRQHANHPVPGNSPATPPGG